jgi:hypothetical protein
LRKDGGADIYTEQNGLPGTSNRVGVGKTAAIAGGATRDKASRLWLTNLKSMQSQLLSRTDAGRI